MSSDQRNDDWRDAFHFLTDGVETGCGINRIADELTSMTDCELHNVARLADWNCDPPTKAWENLHKLLEPKWERQWFSVESAERKKLQRYENLTRSLHLQGIAADIALKPDLYKYYMGVDWSVEEIEKMRRKDDMNKLDEWLQSIGTWYTKDGDDRTHWFAVPGASKKDITVELVDNTLWVSAKWLIADREMTFKHEIHLPYPDGEKITSGVKNGLAWVKVPGEAFHRRYIVPVT